LGIDMKFVAFSGQRFMLSMGLGIEVPTSRAERGLGEGHASLAPTMLSLVDFGRGWVLQSQVGAEIPIAVREGGENNLFYNVTLGKTLMCTVQPHQHGQPARGIHDVTPFVELNGSTLLNGDVYGRTALEVTPGIFWVVGERNEFNVGASFPL